MFLLITKTNDTFTIQLKLRKKQIIKHENTEKC